MKSSFSFETVFVISVPERLEERTLYVSMDYATVVHRCACGCGLEVVTPLSPTDWKLTYDGVAVSLHPSIGNWSFPCRSHYWIDKGVVRWAGDWSEEQVDTGRTHDRHTKERYFKESNSSLPGHGADASAAAWGSGLWSRVKKWLLGR